MAISSAPPPEWPPAGAAAFEAKLDDLIAEYEMRDDTTLPGILWALDLHAAAIRAAMAEPSKPKLTVVKPAG